LVLFSKKEQGSFLRKEAKTFNSFMLACTGQGIIRLGDADAMSLGRRVQGSILALLPC
jgi:hypothetical protein